MNIGETVSRGVAWTTLGAIFNKLLILLNVFLILKHLSVYEYGLAELVFSTVSTVGIILLPGLSSTLIADMGVERARGDINRMKSLFTHYGILMAILGCIAFSILFFAAAPVAALLHSPSVGHLLAIVSFTFLIAPLRTLSILIATVEARFVDQAVYSIAEEVAKACFLLLFFFVLGKGPEGLLYAYVLSPFVAVLVFIPRTLSGYRHFSHGIITERFNFLKLLSTHRKWSVASSYVGTLTQNAQIWIIRLLLGTEAVGLYAFASGIFSNVSSLLPLTGMLSSLAPRYSQKKDSLAKILRISIKAQFILGIVLIVTAISTLPILIWFLPKYAPALPLAYLMLFVIIPTSIYGTFTSVFATLKEQFSFLQSYVFKLVLTVIFIPISILNFGIIGIGIGSVFINSLSGVERYIRLRKVFPELKLTYKDFFTIQQSEYVFMLGLIKKIILRTPLPVSVPESTNEISKPK